MSISFEGGPVDGNELHGFTQRMIANIEPPFVCFSIDGRWEHYERVTDTTYQHTGACRKIAQGPGHPDCGHDHDKGW